eukprot:10703457-Lingulodinium_polyedra.AAC.1
MRQRCARAADAPTERTHVRRTDGGPDNVLQLAANVAPAGNSQRHGGWACSACAHSVLENWAQH